MAQSVIKEVLWSHICLFLGLPGVFLRAYHQDIGNYDIDVHFAPQAVF